MAEIGRIKKIRAGHRSSSTKLQGKALAILQAETDDQDNAVKLETIAENLRSKVETLKQLDEQVINAINEEEIGDEIDCCTDIEISIRETINKIEKFTLRNQTRVVEQATRPRSTSNSSESPSVVSSEIAESVLETSTRGIQPYSKSKLPKIPLPKFNGEITKFFPFWESFESIIDRNESLTQVDKFNYLQSSLEGTAARALEGLPVRELTYDTAVNIIKERFGSKQKVISAHMDQLIKIKTCENENATQLRLVYDQINIQIRGLEAIGVTADKYGSLLIPVIMARLPKPISLQIARHTSNDIWTLGELMDLLRKEVEAREINDEVSVKEKTSTKTHQQQMPTTTSLSVKTKERYSIPTCIFCNKKHFSAQCRTVVDMQKRKELIQKSGRCFRCLGTGHIARNCQTTSNCRNCQKRHHTALCEPKKREPVKEEMSENVVNPTNTNTARSGSSSMLLQTGRSFVYGENPDYKIPVRMMFDTGSHRSYVSNKVADKLGLKSEGTETLNINTFGSLKYNKHVSKRISCYVATQDRESVQVTALTHPQICAPVQPLPDISNFPELLGLQLADQLVDGNCRDEIDMLIGIDFYYSFIAGTIIREETGLVALQSKLGWIVSGPLSSESKIAKSDSQSNQLYVNANLIVERPNEFNDSLSEEDTLIKSFKQAFEFQDETNEENVEAARKRFIESCNVRQNDDRYEVNLPFKSVTKDNLSDNRNLSLKRLKSLYSRLQTSQDLFSAYNKVFREQLRDGIIERVPETEENNTEMFFLPHHGVVREQRQTTKLRIVFDASAKDSSDTFSLNDLLEIGPNYVPNLVGLLLSFRSNLIAITADIEKAFHQISIDTIDRNYLRFYWFENISSENPTIVQYRFARLPFGLTSSPSILGAVIDTQIKKYSHLYPGLLDKINRFYVDDLNTGCKSIEEGIQIYQVAKEITHSAGFNLRKWTSNSKELMNLIRAQESIEVNESYSPHPSHKILGINWNVDRDEIFYEFQEIHEYASKLPITKRSLLKITAKVFDPLGALRPFLIKMKVLFQELAVEKIPWDRELKGEVLKRYLDLLSQLGKLTNISFPRCYFKEKEIVNIQLHGFSDASDVAFASVVYIRIEYSDGEVVVRFVSSKARVTPLKRQSIPRLELLGANLLAKHMSEVKSSLEIEKYSKMVHTFLWTDSLTSLCWIKNVKPWKQYVRNRVTEILKHTYRSEWRFCPGNKNPADIPSRGIRGSKLPDNQTWWEGPQFLRSKSTEWPDLVSTENQVDKRALEDMVKNPPELTLALAVNDPQQLGLNKLSKIVDMSKFNNINKLVKVLEWILRFIGKCNGTNKEDELELQMSERNMAESLIIRSVQAECFQKERIYLTGKGKAPMPSIVSQLNLFIDTENLIRCRTRLKNAPIELEGREPILLPSKHILSELYVREYHNSVYHNGVGETLNAIRQRFWILRGREMVKKFIRRCIICKKLEGLFYKPTPLLDLPSLRVDDGPPFINTGIDFAGPLFVTEPRSKEVSKSYICLFTCMSTRALHLELVESLTVDSFLCAFRRFSARRGLPRKLVSDNAKTFKAASKEVKRIQVSKVVKNYMLNKSILWQFNVPLAAWQGGTWERLVRSVKRCLRKVIGRATIRFEELHTLLVEVEGIINSRPLTYIYDDINGISYPLTPGELISGYTTARYPNGKHFEVISTNESLTRRSKHHRQLLSHFSKRWRNEYLISLREILSQSRQSVEPDIVVGDIVVVKNDFSKRQFWKLGKIEELIIGTDGRVRAAKVRIPASKGSQVLMRSLKHLAPLEIRAHNANLPQPAREQSISNNPQIDTVSKVNTFVDRQRRNAAVIGELKRRDTNV